MVTEEQFLFLISQLKLWSLLRKSTDFPLTARNTWDSWVQMVWVVGTGEEAPGSFSPVGSFKDRGWPQRPWSARLSAFQGSPLQMWQILGFSMVVGMWALLEVSSLTTVMAFLSSPGVFRTVWPLGWYQGCDLFINHFSFNVEFPPGPGGDDLLIF